jgi:hypothetical protein
MAITIIVATIIIIIFLLMLIFPAFKYTSTCKITHQGYNGYNNYRGDNYDDNFSHFLSCLLKRSFHYVHFVNISSL